MQRYWQCETSVEEEEQLRDFFAREQQLPAHLQRYKSWFAGERYLQDCRLDDNFDQRVLSKLEPVVKARRLTLVARLMPLLRAAAVVAVVFMLGNVVQHSFFNEEVGLVTADTIGNQVSAPSVALSKEVQLSKEQQAKDSLEMEKGSIETMEPLINKE